MANLKLKHVYKVYPNGHKAVNDFNIDIQDKEFIVFVGPSGCGKSTTLRMIAGLEDITTGELYIGDRLVNHVEPKDRDIAMVFQSYALYPHMTVYDNMAFGLVNHKTPKEEIKKRVLEAAKILDLTDYLNRTPKEMSGGQMQRVALGRAIVRHPKVFLLDEPLSNLDAKLRASMRTEISKLHKKLQTTFIYVTHDQVEAMTMGTRIVVMKLGVVQQIDTPLNLYNHPANLFVAGFIGTPQMNFFEGNLSKKGNDVYFTIANQTVKLDYSKLKTIDTRYFTNGKKVTLGVRPDHIHFDEKGSLKLIVGIMEQLGNESIVYGSLAGLEVNESMDDEEAKQIIVKLPPNTVLEAGSEMGFAFKEENIHFFDTETGDSIMKLVPEVNYIEGQVVGNKIKLMGSTVNLPEYFLDKIKDKVTLEIPLDAFIEGNDFAFKVSETKNGYVSALADDNYVFIKGDNKEKTITKSIDWSKVKVFVGNELVIDSIKEEVIIPTTFYRGRHEQTFTVYKRKKARDEYGSLVLVDDPKEKTANVSVIYFSLNGDPKTGISYILNHDNMEKLINADGKKVFKNTYDLHIPVNAFDFNGNDFVLDVKEKVGYLNKKYVKIDFNGAEIILPDHSKGDKISFSLNLDEPNIYEHDSMMRMN